MRSGVLHLIEYRLGLVFFRFVELMLWWHFGWEFDDLRIDIVNLQFVCWLFLTELVVVGLCRRRLCFGHRWWRNLLGQLFSRASFWCCFVFVFGFATHLKCSQSLCSHKVLT